MNFQEAEVYLLSLGNEVAAMKLGLESIRALLKALGNPQDNYLKVQVAGTNGKGSVCAFLDSICRTTGVQVGLYTSPHLISITERIRINGENISEDNFARLAMRVRETAESLAQSGSLPSVPTFFEQVTAIALLAFAEAKVELAILETGLGGRLDATTAANSEICAITRIDLDHQEYLGETIEEIAAEKAAIIHPGSQVVIGDQRPEAMKVILERCRELGIEPVIAEALSRTEVGLNGHHQIENAAVAAGVAKELQSFRPISSDDIVAGLRNTRHAGRLEYQDKYLFDGAHNPGGASALARYLDELEQRPLTLVFGAMVDKPIIEMLGLLVPRAERIVLTQPANERAASYDKLLEAMPDGISKETTFATDTVSKAIDIAKTVTPQDGIILVTGSLYLVGEVKKILSQKPQFEI